MKYRVTKWNNGYAQRLDMTSGEIKPLTNHQEWFDLSQYTTPLSQETFNKVSEGVGYAPRRDGDETPYICSIEVGTPSKGAMKVYFDPANIQETNIRIKNTSDALALGELLRSDEFRESIYARMSIVAGEMVIGELEKDGDRE